MKKLISISLAVLLLATAALPITSLAAPVFTFAYDYTTYNSIANDLYVGDIVYVRITHPTSNANITCTLSSQSGEITGSSVISGSIVGLKVNGVGWQKVQANYGGTVESFDGGSLIGGAKGYKCDVRAYRDATGKFVNMNGYGGTKYYYSGRYLNINDLAPTGFSVSKVTIDGQDYTYNVDLYSLYGVGTTTGNVGIPSGPVKIDSVYLNYNSSTGTNTNVTTGSPLSVAVGSNLTLTNMMMNVDLSSSYYSVVSSDPSTAMVINNYSVYGARAGTCVLMVVENYTGRVVSSVSVNVTPYGTSTTSGGTTIPINGSMDLNYTTLGLDVSSGRYQFYSSDPDVAVISGYVLYARKVGTVSLMVVDRYTGGIVINRTIQVVDNSYVTPVGSSSTGILYIGPKSFSVMRRSWYIFQNIKCNGVRISNSDVVWVSSDKKAVEVTKAGKFRGLKSGASAIITATTKDGNYTATIVVNVN